MHVLHHILKLEDVIALAPTQDDVLRGGYDYGVFRRRSRDVTRALLNFRYQEKPWGRPYLD